MRGIGKFAPFGGMDKDTDPLYIKDGDYVDALNVRHITDNTESQQAYIPIKGNTYRYQIPSLVEQLKIFRVYHEAIAATSRTLTVYKTDGSVFFTATYADGATFDLTSTAMQASLTAAAGAATPAQSFIYTHTPGSNYTDISMLPVFSYEYDVRSTGANDVVVINIQEAIAEDVIGSFSVIGSYDLLGDSIILSTCQDNLPSTISPTITSTLNNGSGQIRVTTSAAHGLVNGEEIVITGATDTSLANGRWIVNIINSTTFDLYNSLVGTNSTVGNIEINTNGFGEIGVATYNANTNAWTYTRLIRSKEFNFVTQKQIKCYAEKTNDTINLYWVDDYNVPRVFYYKGAYIQDGALNFVNDDGQYEYGSISAETTLMIANIPAQLTFLDQIQLGGQLLHGNWEYSIRFLSENLTATDWSDVSQPINVFYESTAGQPLLISGAINETITPKINELQVTGIIPGLFKFIELAAIRYAEGSVAGYIVRREDLAEDQDEIVLRHTGTEADVRDLDLGELLLRSIPYVTAQNIDAIDNRLILSNLTSRAIADLSEWAQAFEHNIKRESITGVGEIATGPYRIGEYQDPANVFSKVGYMWNETYRFGVKGRYRETGEFSPVFWIDDIVINTAANNNQPGYTPSPNRRLFGLPGFDLTPAGAVTDVYVPYVEFSNIDLDFSIDGVSIRELFSELIFERAECVKEVLATGCVAMSMTGYYFPPTYPANALGYETGGVFRFGEFPSISGLLDGANGATPLYVPVTDPRERNICKLYSPDIFCSEAEISLITGDVLINYGGFQRLTADPANIYNSNIGTILYYSSLHEHSGWLNSPVPTTHTITQATMIGSGSSEIGLSGGGAYNNVLKEFVLPSMNGTDRWINKAGLLMECSTDLNNPSGNTDYGFYYTQYFRAIPYLGLDDNKYGNRNNTKYIPTGTRYTIDDSSPSVISTGVINVFGGDALTQKFILKHRGEVAYPYGGGGGVLYYAQNRVNSQMIVRYPNVGSLAWVYPLNLDTTLWLEDLNLGTDEALYDSGYTPKNIINSDVAFNTDEDAQTDYRTRIIYSELKPVNALTDNFRIFLPLNFKDLSPSFGPITHHANGNGELLTWQRRAFMRQYFNTRGTLQLSGGDGSEALIGSGAVLDRDGQTMSVIGCKHVWGVVKGKSAQGNDVFYWINTELKKMMRLGFDGTVSLADIRGMQSYLANNLTWVDLYDTPAYGVGLHGVWDDRNAEVVFTARAHKTAQAAWATATGYVVGNSVYLTDEANYQTFEQTYEIYVCILNHTSGASTKPGVGASWQTAWSRKSHTDNSYYNEWTLVFNEFKNKYTAFYSFLPKIYIKWADTYLSPRPVPDTLSCDIYQHNIGSYCSWYLGIFNPTVQEVDGYLEAVINDAPDETKWFEAMRVDSEIVPYRYDFTTKTQISFLTESEFETREDYSIAPIKEDSTITGLNDADTSLLYGKYIKAKMTFRKLVYQKLVGFVMKFRISPRVIQK